MPAPPPRVPRRVRLPGKGQTVYGTEAEAAAIKQRERDAKKAEEIRDAPFAGPRGGTGKAAPAVVTPPKAPPPKPPVVKAAPQVSAAKPAPAATPPVVKKKREPKPSQAPRVVAKATPKTAAAKPALSQAEQIVQAALAPLYAQLDAAKREQGIQDTARQQALSGFTKEIIGYLQGGAGAVGSDYDRAIQQTDQLAQTAATGLINANPNAQTQADLAAIGAPGAQQAQVAAQNQQIFGGGGATLYKTEGAIPGSSLAESKAAQQAYQRGLPSIFAAEGTNALKGLLFQSAADARSLADKRAEVQSKRPGLLLEAEASLADMAAKRQASDINLALAQSLIGDRAFGQKAEAVRLDQAQQNISLRQADLLSSLYGTDASGNLTLDGRRVAALETKNAKAAKGIPASKYAQLKKDALKQADLYYYGNEEKGVGAINYQKALANLMNGYSLKLVDAQNILNTYYKPGEDGRPFLTFQQRNLLRGKGVSKAKINAAMYDGQLAQALLGRL